MRVLGRFSHVGGLTVLVNCDRVWDARKLQKIAVPDDKPAPIEIEAEDIEAFVKTGAGKTCMRGELRHGKSVSSAYWDPHGRRILSTCYDDTLRCKYCWLDVNRLVLIDVVQCGISVPIF